MEKRNKTKENTMHSMYIVATTWNHTAISAIKVQNYLGILAFNLLYMTVVTYDLIYKKIPISMNEGLK